MTTPTRGGSASRMAAIAAAAAVVAFAGLLALPALRGAAPPADAAMASAARGSERLGAWLVEADAALLPNLGYRLDIRLTGDAGAPPPDTLRPEVVVSMNGMPDIAPALTATGAGAWRAEGTLPMAGRWRFGIGLDGGLMTLPVDVQSGGMAM